MILDTNIIIDHLRLGNPANSIFANIMNKHPKKDLAISIITVQELYGGQSTRENEVGRAIIGMISQLKILPYTHDVAKYAGEIARDLNSPISLADAAIAATTLLNKARLLTLNKKDFQGIKNLEFA